mgnify:CR=1 FL=1
MEKDQARKRLLEEYPFLTSGNTQIQTQFIASDGRASHAFLVTV